MSQDQLFVLNKLIKQTVVTNLGVGVRFIPCGHTEKRNKMNQ